MKRIIGIAAAVLLVATVMVGCASTPQGEYGGIAEAHKAGRPGWAQPASVSFREHEIEKYNAPNPNEAGLFCSGYGDRGNTRTSTITARLAARSELAATVAAGARRVAGDSDSSASQWTEENVDSTLVGSRIVDSVSNPETGEVWVLMFISKTDLKNSYKNKSEASVINELLDTWWLESSYER